MAKPGQGKPSSWGGGLSQVLVRFTGNPPQVTGHGSAVQLDHPPSLGQRSKLQSSKSVKLPPLQYSLGWFIWVSVSWQKRLRDFNIGPQVPAQLLHSDQGVKSTRNTVHSKGKSLRYIEIQLHVHLRRLQYLVWFVIPVT